MWASEKVQVLFRNWNKAILVMELNNIWAGVRVGFACLQEMGLQLLLVSSAWDLL